MKLTPPQPRVLLPPHRVLPVRRPSHTVDPLGPIVISVFLDNDDFGFIPSQSLTDPIQTLDMIFIFHLLFIYKKYQ